MCVAYKDRRYEIGETYRIYIFELHNYTIPYSPGLIKDAYKIQCALSSTVSALFQYKITLDLLMQYLQKDICVSFLIHIFNHCSLLVLRIQIIKVLFVYIFSIMMKTVHIYVKLSQHIGLKTWIQENHVHPERLLYFSIKLSSFFFYYGHNLLLKKNIQQMFHFNFYI